MPVEIVRNSNVRCNGSSSRCLHIGLINNMPDGALKATERQFLTLLDSAANGALVHVSLYALLDVPRGEFGRRHILRHYCGIRDLWNSCLDGLIVTGTEPKAPDLTDEPYWGSLTQALDWAENNTYSAIWSCLAAHAAVLHNDGIGRRRLAEKRFGVFECVRASDHPLTAGVTATFPAPHSRWNDIADNLLDCGYHVLTRAADGPVDIFIKQRKSLFVFFQGHPEYEANTLLLEYRRDIVSYLRGERDTYPEMPRGYFDRDSANALTALRERAPLERGEELLVDFPSAWMETKFGNPWRSMATGIYGNWLAHLREQKERRSTERQRRSPLSQEKPVERFRRQAGAK